MIRIFKYNLTAITFLLKNVKLWKYCVIPFILSLLIMAILTYLIFWGYDYLLTIDPKPVESVGVVSGLINNILNFLKSGLAGIFKWLIFLITTTAIIWYGFSTIASLAMLPFLELLSNEVETELRGKKLENPWYAGLLSSFLFSMAFTALKIFFLVISMLICLFFPPFIIVSFFLTAWFCSMESQDYCMSRHLFSISGKIKFLFSQKFNLIYLGSFSSLLLMIPFVSILQPILASVSGAIYFVSKTPELGLKDEYRGLVSGELKNG